MLAPLVSESFFNQSVGSSVTYSGGAVSSGSGSSALSSLDISYDAGADSYALSEGLVSAIFAPGDVASSTTGAVTYETTDGDTTERLNLGIGYDLGYQPARIYSAVGRWITTTTSGADTFYKIENFVYGMPTADAQVPVSGRASYRLSLLGTRSTISEPSLMSMGGGGALLVDFGAGVIDLNMFTLSQRLDGGSTMTDNFLGTISGSGTLSALANDFNGSFTLSHRNGPEVYSGSFDGLFFGPSGAEAGGTLYGTAGEDDIFVSAAFAGSREPDVASGDTLNSLTGLNHFLGLGLSTNFDNILSSHSISYFVSYDADTGTYLFRPGIPADFNGQGEFSIDPGDRAPALDTGDYEFFRIGAGLDELQVGIFDGSSDGINLTYASFARVLGMEDNGGSPRETLDFVSFGYSTPLHQIPTSGTANYSGVVFGDARDNAQLLYPIYGSSNLSVDFAAQSVAATLSLEKGDGIGGIEAIGDFSFGGAINPAFGVFFGSVTSGDPGNMLGIFYGDTAQEFAATFYIYDASEYVTYDGITLGIQD